MKKNIINSIKSKLHVKFQISLLLLIFIILAISTFTTLSAVLSVNRNVSKQKAEQLFNETGLSIKIKLDNQLDKAIQLTGLITTLPEFSEPITMDVINHPGIPFLIEALKRNSYFYSIYSGFNNGDFIQLIQTSANPLIMEAHKAPETTAYILRAISGEAEDRQEYWTFLDSDLTAISSSLNENPEYKPFQRPWFKEAIANPDNIILTEPYIYDSLQKPGITAAAAIDTSTVAGIDITLANLQSFINSIHISPGTGILVLDKDDRVLAANKNIIKWLNTSNSELGNFDSMRSAERKFISGETPGKTEQKRVRHLTETNLLWKDFWETPGGQQYHLIITAPASDFLEHQQIIQRRIIMISTIIFILVLPLILLTSVYLSRFLEHLSVDAERIQHFVFDGEIAEHSPILEFEELAEAFRVMKKAIAAKTQALENALSKLEKIINLGIAMSAEKSPDKIVEMILKGAKELSGADGGSLYLIGDKDELDFKIVLNNSLGFAQGGTSGNPITMPPVQLYNENGELNFNNVVSSAYHKAVTIAIDDAYKDPDYDFSGTKRFDKLNNYQSTSFLTVPLKLLGSDIIGALQLINCISPEDNKVVSFSKDIQSFIEALSSLAAAILYNRITLDSQEELFESLIQMTSTLENEDNSCTEDHCSQVPVLSQMLAEKADLTIEGPLKDFKFKTPLEKKAFIIGAWIYNSKKTASKDLEAEEDSLLSQLSIPSRIMTIADFFVSITSDVHTDTNRNKLSEAVEILYRKTMDNPIDANLFELFLNTGIYREYAEKFLPEDMIDEVDIRKYLG